MGLLYDLLTNTNGISCVVFVLAHLLATPAQPHPQTSFSKRKENRHCVFELHRSFWREVTAGTCVIRPCLYGHQCRECFTIVHDILPRQLVMGG